MRRTLGWLVQGVIALHGLLVAVMPWLARHDLGGASVALLAAFWPLWSALTLLLVPVAWRLRRRPARVAQSLALLVLLGWSLPWLRPHPHPSAPYSKYLKLMTFNVSLGDVSADELVRVLDRHHPDIVTMQEAVPSLADPLPAALGQRYAHSVMLEGEHQIMLLSRFPIVSHEWIAPPDGGRETMRVVIDRDGIPLVVYAVHPEPPGIAWFPAPPVAVGLDDRAGQRQINDIAARVAAETSDVLVMGDFNLSERSRAIATLGTGLNDAFRTAGVGRGPGFTFPNGLSWRGVPVPSSFVRIDYIFHSRTWRTDAALVDCETPSDHCALVVDLARVE